MAEFSYIAYKPDGARVSGWIQATTQSQAQKELRKRGLFPVEFAQAEAKSAGHPKTLPQITPKGAPAPPRLRAVATWAARMAALTEGGVELARALEISANTPKPGRTEQAARDMLQRLRSGAAISDAAEASGHLNRQAIAILRAGEQIGDLATAFCTVADLYTYKLTLRRTVQTALIYPSILFIFAVISLVAMLGFVIPRFEVIFIGAEDQLPQSTEWVMAASRGLRDYWPIVIAGFGLPVGIGILGMRSAQVRSTMAHLALRLPFVGPILQKLDLSALTANLCIFLRADVALLQALELTAAIVPHSGLGQNVDEVLENVRQGQLFSAALAEATDMPSDIISMLRAGEESGRLPEMLELISTTERAEAEAAIKQLLSILEPVMILAIGAIVGGMIFSIFQAILSINDVVL